MAANNLLNLQVLFVVGIILVHGNSAQELRKLDLLAMKEIAVAWNHSMGWTGENPCSWTGVKCATVKSGILFTSETTVVVSITTRGVCRNVPAPADTEEPPSCTLPSALGKLADLKYLYLNGNDFQGNIPEELSQLSELEALYLNVNRLTGTIPASLGKLRQLKKLYLNTNELHGAIPPEIGEMKNLIQLELQKNELHGTIPEELSHLKQLIQIDLNDNELEGTIPASLGNLTSLHRLNLHKNLLTGTIPASIFGAHMPSLTIVDLSDNRFVGVVPIGICKLKNLAVFNAEHNEDLMGDTPRCEPEHGPHSDEENRRNCRDQLRPFCVLLPQVRDEL